MAHILSPISYDNRGVDGQPPNDGSVVRRCSSDAVKKAMANHLNLILGCCSHNHHEGLVAGRSAHAVDRKA